MGDLDSLLRAGAQELLPGLTDDLRPQPLADHLHMHASQQQRRAGVS
jgi:hypothetical protein